MTRCPYCGKEIPSEEFAKHHTECRKQTAASKIIDAAFERWITHLSEEELRDLLKSLWSIPSVKEQILKLISPLPEEYKVYKSPWKAEGRYIIKRK